MAGLRIRFPRGPPLFLPSFILVQMAGVSFRSRSLPKGLLEDLLPDHHPHRPGTEYGISELLLESSEKDPSFQPSYLPP